MGTLNDILNLVIVCLAIWAFFGWRKKCKNKQIDKLAEDKKNAEILKEAKEIIEKNKRQNTY